MPQVLLDHVSLSPKGLTNISMSKLQWPQVAMPTPTCWLIWTTTIRSLYTGSRTGTHLQTPLGAWSNNYNMHQFWNWQLSDTTHLLYQQQANTSPQVTLRTQSRRTLAKFSPTIPTLLPFQGRPVTPMDPTTGYVRLPVTCLPELPKHHPVYLYISTIQNQFWDSLPPWQQVLFRSLRKVGSTNTLLGYL